MRRGALTLCAAALAAAFVHHPASAYAGEAPTYDPRTAFAETDTNHDAYVDNEEFVLRITEVFFEADTDKDGFLSLSEIHAALVRPEELTSTDSNQDAKLSLHEFRRVRLLDFEQADTNDDGLLSLQEVIDASQKKQGT